jgi:hypothetical protein
MEYKMKSTGHFGRSSHHPSTRKNFNSIGTRSIGASVSLRFREENWIGTLERFVTREGATRDEGP